MAENFLLTVAIPTYNRALLLDETLKSVTEQIGNRTDVEVVVSDNASTDQTFEIVSKYMNSFPNVKYFKNEVNRGIDYNIYKVAQLATGEYVQFLSDDDFLMPNSLNKILNLIAENKDVSFFYLNSIGFKYDSDHEKIYNQFPTFRESQNVLFDKMDDFICFLGLQITYVSAFLFHRQTWNINQNKSRYIGTDIYLSYDLLHHLSNSKKYMFVQEPLIASHEAYTTGNYRIFYAFAYQWRKLLLKEAVDLGYDKHKMKAMFRNTIGHLVSRIKAIKLGQVNAKIDLSTLKVIFISTYDTSIFWLKIVPTLLTPSWFLKLKKKLRARKRASERG